MYGGPAPLLLCVGDIDMDIIVKVPRLPGRDQKVDGQRVAQTPGGMAANVAVGAQRLGTATRLLGAVGDDAMGRDALAALGQENLDLTHIATRGGAATFFCIIMVDQEGEKCLVKAVSPAYLPQPADLVPAAFAGVKHLHLTFTRHELAMTAVARAKAVGASISLDLEAADIPSRGGEVADLVAQVDLLFVSDQSRVEAERIMGPLLARPYQTIVTTLGRKGARVESAAGIFEAVGHTISVTDTSGAGDAFAAAFLHSRLDGADDAASLRFANAAAALSTRAYGAQAGLPRRTDVVAFLDAKTHERIHD
jgi:sugar/nucleoside kinase (ribokinase family)